MKLNNEQLIDYSEAFKRLDGYARAVTDPRGQNQIVLESYDLSPKCKWRATLNIDLMLMFRNAFEKRRKDEKKLLNDFIKELDPKMDPSELARLIQAKEQECNDRLAALGKEEVDIPGLVPLPGAGIRIRARDPGLISILGLLLRGGFIDGEPDYGQTKEEREATRPKKAEPVE